MKKSLSPEDCLTYADVQSDIRPVYEALIGTLTIESYQSDIHEAAEDFLCDMACILESDQPHKLDLHYPMQFFRYGVEGIPLFVLYPDGQGGWRERTQEELTDLQFGLQIDTFCKYNGYFESSSEVSRRTAISMIVVLNMVCARMKLDAAILSEGNYDLSVAEVALLAGMKEKSVRNLATKEMGATYSKERSRTVISAARAAEWLAGRRKFVPTRLPKSEAAREAIVQIADEYFG